MHICLAHLGNPLSFRCCSDVLRITAGLFGRTQVIYVCGGSTGDMEHLHRLIPSVWLVYVTSKLYGVRL